MHAPDNRAPAEMTPPLLDGPGLLITIKIAGAWQTVYVRPLLLVMAALAEYRLLLPKNRAKGGWSGETPDRLLDRAFEEMAEVETALASGETWEAAFECADVLNMLMMSLDNTGLFTLIPGDRN